MKMRNVVSVMKDRIRRPDGGLNGSQLKFSTRTWHMPPKSTLTRLSSNSDKIT
jgi:hypothetical protein